jgi:hypothetical protein
MRYYTARLPQVPAVLSTTMRTGLAKGILERQSGLGARLYAAQLAHFPGGYRLGSSGGANSTSEAIDNKGEMSTMAVCAACGADDAQSERGPGLTPPR